MKSYSVALLLGILPVLVSCGGEKVDETNVETDKLYMNICTTLTNYTDSIRTAPDSASVYALLERYGEHMDAVNYEALPDTDYHLNESQNDTILMLMDSLINTCGRRLEEFASHGATAQSDSISVDSAKL